MDTIESDVVVDHILLYYGPMCVDGTARRIHGNHWYSAVVVEHTRL